MIGRIGKSVTLIVGILLTVGAFFALLMVGRVFNPPPYHVVVAIQEIPAFTPITKDMLALDDQQVAATVARGYVLREELDKYLGAVAIEPIHKAEPLVKARLLTGEAIPSRLALALSDPDEVAMTIPVDSHMCPDSIVAGDFIDVIFGVGTTPRRIEEEEQPATSLAEWTQISLNPASQGESGEQTSSEALTVTLPALPGIPLAVTEEGPILFPVNMPFAKSVLREVPVLEVRRRQQMAAYGMGAEEVQAPLGPIEALDVLIPADAQEMLAFAIENGSLRIVVLSPLVAAREEESSPTIGVTWQDVLYNFQRDRLQAILALTPAATPIPSILEGTPTPVPSEEGVPAATPGLVPSAEPTSQPLPTPLPSPTPTEPPAQKGSAGPVPKKGYGAGGIVIVVILLAIIIVVVGIVVVVFLRRKKER